MGNNQSGGGETTPGKKPEFNVIPKMFSLTIWIPTEQVGMIIGKKGATIQKIQKDTSSIVTVPVSGTLEIFLLIIDQLICTFSVT